MRGEASAVLLSVWAMRTFPLGVAIAQVRAARLPVVQRRAAVGLAILAEARDPALDVVHPELAEPHVAGRGLDHLVGDLERPKHFLRQFEQPGMPAGRYFVVRRADDILLDLDELVDAQQPAHILAGAARLAAKAGRIAGIEDRQAIGVEDLARMERGQCDFGGACQPQLVVRELVGLLPVARELPLDEKGLLARQRGHGDRREARLRDPLERPEPSASFRAGPAAP